jgi:NitT/TauT family transport system substrate-binding protein
LRLATIPIDGGVQAAYAETQGYWKDAGLTAQTEYTTNGGAIAAAVSSGAIDIGYSNFLTLAVAHEHGVPFTVIAPAGIYTTKAPISSLLIPVDSTVKAARDLNGKVVAVNGLKNITQLATEAWSDVNGGDWHSLRFVEMSFAEIPAALAAHRIDAGFVTEPIVSDAIRRKSARVIGNPYDAIAPEFTISVWFTTRAWASANAALVRRFGSVIRQASLWANDHDAQSAPLLSEIAKLPLAAIEGMTRSRFAPSLTARSVQPIIDAAAKYGLLAKAFPASDIIDPNAS